MMVFLGMFLFCSAIYLRRFCSVDYRERNFADYASSVSLIFGYSFFLVGMIDFLIDFFI